MIKYYALDPAVSFAFSLENCWIIVSCFSAVQHMQVLVIAILLKMIMKRRFSILQWEALALLLIGISINQLRSIPDGATSFGLPVATGAYLYTLTFVTVPSLASVFNEYALKSQYESSIYHQVGQCISLDFTVGACWLEASMVL
ncbi:hypothetical protein V6N13_051192 [Hibiscus sabdariffa]